MPDFQKNRLPSGKSGARHRGGNNSRSGQPQTNSVTLPQLLMVINGQPTSTPVAGYTPEIICSKANIISLADNLKTILSSVGLADLATSQNSFAAFTLTSFESKTTPDAAEIFGFMNGNITNERLLRSMILKVKFLLAFYKDYPTYENYYGSNASIVAGYAVQIHSILSIIQKKSPLKYKELILSSKIEDCL